MPDDVELSGLSGNVTPTALARLLGTHADFLTALTDREKLQQTFSGEFQLRYVGLLDELYRVHRLLREKDEEIARLMRADRDLKAEEIRAQVDQAKIRARAEGTEQLLEVLAMFAKQLPLIAQVARRYTTEDQSFAEALWHATGDPLAPVAFHATPYRARRRQRGRDRARRVRHPQGGRRAIAGPGGGVIVTLWCGPVPRLTAASLRWPGSEVRFVPCSEQSCAQTATQHLQDVTTADEVYLAAWGPGVDVAAVTDGHGLGCPCKPCRERMLATRGKPFPAGSLGELLQELAAAHRGGELLKMLRWQRAAHNTRPGVVYEIRENPNDTWDVREIGADEPCTRGVGAAYIRAEFRIIKG